MERQNTAFIIKCQLSQLKERQRQIDLLEAENKDLKEAIKVLKG